MLKEPVTEGTVIVGCVTSAGGQPASGANVAVIGMRLQPARGGDLRPNGKVLAAGTAGENGQYELRLAGVSSKMHAYASVIARKDGVVAGNSHHSSGTEP